MRTCLLLLLILTWISVVASRVQMLFKIDFHCQLWVVTLTVLDLIVQLWKLGCPCFFPQTLTWAYFLFQLWNTWHMCMRTLSVRCGAHTLSSTWMPPSNLCAPWSISAMLWVHYHHPSWPPTPLLFGFDLRETNRTKAGDLEIGVPLYHWHWKYYIFVFGGEVAKGSHSATLQLVVCVALAGVPGLVLAQPWFTLFKSLLVLRVQELHKSRGGRRGSHPSLSLVVLMVSLDIRQHWTWDCFQIQE